ncbi:GH12750 [Drosophila grimshawi]|uniref:GH12750 n=1 Tax=Drosophila grimshawi TaxID=7222 RepID=B4JKX6_DROGR|nr:GH12750 [Drosophila grimshawi]
MPIRWHGLLTTRYPPTPPHAAHSTAWPCVHIHELSDVSSSFVLSCHFDVVLVLPVFTHKNKEYECRSNEFRCRNGDCIDNSKRCDNVPDCLDGDDEGDDCPASCSDMEYQCRDGSRCISVSQQCDGQVDCNDGDDEDHCDGIVPKLRFTCPKGKFTCRDLSCISIVHRCDGRTDCPHDRSDEEGCPCLYDKWQCDDGTCIAKELLCNGNIDCPEDISDERYCDGGYDAEECRHNQFRCRNGECIPMRQVCDNIYDCSDYTDEQDCDLNEINENRDRDNDYFDGDGIIRIYADHHRPKIGRHNDNDNNIPIYGINEEDAREYELYLPSEKYDKSSQQNPCTSSQFRCNNGVCIPNHLRCDGFHHCNDMSDEDNCDHYVPPFTTRRPVTRAPTTMNYPWPSVPPASLERQTTSTPPSRVTAATPSSSSSSSSSPSSSSPWSSSSLPSNCLENIEFACHNRDCIPIESVCDGEPDCEEHEDEDYSLCNCSNDKYKCVRGGGCIPKTQVCDGKSQCRDGSDESACHFHAKFNKSRPIVECLSFQYQCGDGSCISGYKRCNGITDCADGADEYNCLINYDDTNYDTDPDNDPLNECDLYNFECDFGQCIPFEKKCDGYADCEDQTDELDCPAMTEHCLEHEFECDDYCIPRDQLCNGIVNCNDGNDERNCTYCREDAYLCNTGDCIASKLHCNGIVDCSDASDELNCGSVCAPDQIACNGNCLDSSLRCDNKFDCDDGIDELDCEGNNSTIRLTAKDCSQDQFFCDDSCFDRSIRCNGHYECTDRSDEHDCHTTHHTRHPYYPPLPCPQHACPSGRCYTESERCDGHRHCEDNSDEANCTQCKDSEFFCYDRQFCINATQHCDGFYDCKDFSDEQNCIGCARDQFRCRDGDCVPLDAVCDNYAHCSDGSDEENCNPMQCQANQFRCRNGQCVSSAMRCDRRTDCQDSSDEQDCGHQHTASSSSRPASIAPTTTTTTTSATSATTTTMPLVPLRIICPSTTFRCENGPCISLGSRCNGVIDCPYDASDELDCAPITNEIDTSDPPQSGRSQLNLKTYPSSQIIKESREVIFRCRDEGPARAKVKWSRPGGRPLPVGFSDKGGRLEIPNIRVEDSGTYICEAVGYPAYVEGQQVTVNLNVERSWGEHKYEEPKSNRIKYGTVPHIDLEFFGLVNNAEYDRPPSACSAYQATCMNGECIDKSKICDGYPDCSDNSDEHSCSQGRRCQPNQFLCRNSKCVERTWRCDGEDDCGDNSDEQSCDPEPNGAPCRYNEFQCSSGHCIPKSFQCDKLNDCRDGSDEFGCISPNPIRPPPPLETLMEGQSLNLTCTATGVPVPTIVWRLNWGHVPDKCISKSAGGRGDLYCPNMQYQDSGAYSCEIINTIGTHFVIPDTIVTVIPERNQFCPAGFFNMLARSRDDCIKCFCFGVASACESANLFTYAIQPPIISHRVVSVDLSPYQQIVINEVPSQNLVNLNHGLQFRASDVQYNSREAPYLALPSDYMGNQLKSYGGHLKYEINYMGSGSPVSGPDVIITGNGFILTYAVRTQPNLANNVDISFMPGNWLKPDGRKATREELMMILANVDNILIRLGYISMAREVEVVHIAMDSAGTSDQGLGSASLVEKCNCPPGYVGDSCETCAPGYVRQPGGAWLGRCVPFVAEPCPVGTYGDPRRGIQCRDCPCPHSGSNNFANGCQLSPDGDVICNCYEGYVGRRCESCAAGYQGNPLVPGGSCHKTPESMCNVEGTYNHYSNGTCQCKDLVMGDRCDTCAPKSFHLNSFTYTGCIECFCSGWMADCTSTSWYRDQISSSFGRSSAPHGFTLVRDYTRPTPQAVPFNTLSNAISFSSDSDYSADTLYWSLPAQFLGNKLTAYGGRLNYTLSYSPLPGGQMSRNNAPDVVIKSGEDLTLIHYRKSSVSPSTSSSYAVPIVESAWQRSDGQVINRPHLLMALSKIDAIYIKATYTTGTMEGSLKHVALDIASANNQGTPRAYEVEECRCPVGYIGLSCERCAPGFKRNPEEGLYLGACEQCTCNGHSSQCEAETGECLDPVYVSWSKMGSRLPNTAEIEGGVLNLYNLQIYDSGVYICQAMNNQTLRVFKDEVSITISNQSQRSPAQIVNLPSTVTFDEYQPSEITCEVEGNPTPTITWTHVDAQGDGRTRTDGNRLIFELPRKSDEGRYRCQVQNQYGADEKYVDVYVRGNAPQPAPVRERVFIQPEDYNGKAGDTVTFNCHSTSGAQLRYEWLHNGRPLSSQQQRNVIIAGDMLEIRDASASDSGVYTCIGIDLRTRRNYTEEARVYIEQHQLPPPVTGIKPHIMRLTEKASIDQGTDYSITCESSGSPYPSIQWMKDGESMPSNVHITGNVMRIINARPENRGYYSCTAENPYGSDHSSVLIDVEPREAPSVDITPAVPMTFTVKQQGYLYCVAQGIPVPTVQWRRIDGKPLTPRHMINEENAGYVIIHDIEINDAGDYECVAENSVGRSTGIATIRVVEPPVVTLNPNTQVMSYTEGDEVHISCIASGVPNPAVQWDTNQPISLSSRGQNIAYLDINRVTHNDARIYTCSATNEAGSDQASIRIEVQPKRGDIGDAYGDVVHDPYPSHYPELPTQRPYYNPNENTQKFTTNLGENVTLTCDLAPYLSTRWARVDGQPLLSNAHTDRNILTITLVEEQNLGQYRCNAVDNHGSLVTYVVRELVLLPLPQITFSPNIPLVVEADTNVDIQCRVINAEPHNVHWATDNGRPLPSSVHINGTLLSFVAIAPADAGGYSCTATNDYGNHSKTAQVVVRRPTFYTPPTQSDVQEHREGDSIQLRCTVSTQRGEHRGNVQFHWYREDRRPLPNGARPDSQELILTSLRMDDAGVYICDSYDRNLGQRLTPTSIDLRVQHLKVSKITPAKPLAAPPRPSVISYACQANDFKCVSHPHTCVKSSMVCDGIYDCTDHSDEFNCTRDFASKAASSGPTGIGIGIGTATGTGTGTGLGNFKRWKKSHARKQKRHQQQHRRPEQRQDQQQQQHQHRAGMTKRQVVPLAKRFAGGYLPPVLRTPPPEPMMPRDYSLKLDQQSSKLRTGESTQVECYSSDNSYTDVIWERFDGAPLSANIQQVGNSLVINKVTAADAGVYVCKCRTDDGDLYTTSYELGIEEQPESETQSESEPEPEPHPEDLRQPKIVHAQAGDQTQLSCGADESRQPSYRWSRQYGQLQSGRDIHDEQLVLQDVQANDAGSYVCTATYNDGESVDYPSILVITGAIPHFHQLNHPKSSYMSFPKLPESSFKFNFEVTFRPESPNGLLLFNGQPRGTGDYIALSLKDRYAEFRFDFGGKPLVVRAEQPVKLNEWHTIRVQRSRRDGYIQLDEQRPVAFPTLSQTPQLELIADLYIGGVPNWDQLPAEAVTEDAGFVGCISRLTLQGRTIELMKEAKMKEGITSCKPCAQMPCENNGICLESQTEQAYTCICQQGWTGRNCAVEGTQCTPGLCGAGRCENTETDMECLCPLNRTGDRCQYIEHLNEHSLNFKRNSYAAYNTPRAGRLNVTLSLRPSSLRDAVLLYTAESNLPSGDYVALLLHDGHVELIINTAARLKPVVVRSQQPLPLHRWTRVELQRRQGESILRVGDESELRAKAAGAPRMLSLKTPLYVGGYDWATVKINRDVNITDGFDGCISRLFDSTRSIQLLADIKDAANVQNCGELNEIGDADADVDADGELPIAPVIADDDEPQPYALSPCASEPCDNGGTCTEVDQQAICDCSLGFSGKRCEDHIQVSFNASFRGNGYMELDRNQFNSEVDQQYTTAAILFSTSKPDGLLMWWGQQMGEEFTGQDFIALAVVEGYVELSLRLDGQEAMIRNSEKQVNDGHRHLVLVKRADNTAILEVDRISESVETRPTSKKEMHLPGNVLIGGIPHIMSFTGQRYGHNFNGCMFIVEGNTGQINVGKAAINGVNVDTCPVGDEARGGTEPPVV